MKINNKEVDMAKVVGMIKIRPSRAKKEKKKNYKVLVVEGDKEYYFYTMRAAAEHCGVPEGTFQRWWRTHRGSPARNIKIIRLDHDL